MAMKVVLMYGLPRTSGVAPGAGESHYYLGAATAANDAALVANAIDMMNARTQLCGNNVVAIGFRVSIPGTRNRSYRVLVGTQAGAGLNLAPIVSQGTADTPDAAVKLDLYSAKLQRGGVFMAGLPDAFRTTANAGQPDFGAAGLSGYRAKWDTWTALLLNGNWGFKARADLPVGEPKEITSWANQPDSPFELIMGVATADGVWGVNDIVQVRRVLMKSDFQDRPTGRWIVRSVSTVGTEKLYVLRNSGDFDASQIDVPGTVETVAFEYVPYDTYQIAKQGSRRRGVGPLRPHGRSRRRRRRVVS